MRIMTLIQPRFNTSRGVSQLEGFYQVLLPCPDAKRREHAGPRRYR
jgi:hypothetical protein